jgi:hypothetical protein
MSTNDRVSVQTYVPADQREMWRQEAADMDMSQAEYVRSMVQAGRRSFDLGDGDGETSETREDGGPPDATPGVSGLKDRILEVVRAEGVAAWDDVRAGVTNDIDQRIEDALSELQADGVIRYSGRRDGYVEVEDGG